MRVVLTARIVIDDAERLPTLEEAQEALEYELDGYPVEVVDVEEAS